MADSKITALTALTAADPANDMIPIVDVSDTPPASGNTKRISINNILACSPSATLASATITGDLTVRTNKLAVTSTGVGVGTASPALPFVVSNAGAQGFEINPNGSIVSGGIDILSYNRSTSLYKGAGFAAESYLFRVGTVSATDAMTLNATGLGVGASPTRKLSIVGSGATYANINSGDNTSLVGLLLGGTSTPSAGQLIYDNTANSLSLFTSGASRFLIDSSGNVGISRASTGNKLEAPGVGIDGRATVGGVSTVATTIYTIKQSATAAMCVVFGDNGADGFCDIVLFLATVAPKVVSSQTLYGSPAARTYSVSTTNLQLALASGTLSIRTAALSTLNT